MSPSSATKPCVLRKNGTLVPVSVILSPVKDARGKLLGFAAIYSDIPRQ